MPQYIHFSNVHPIDIQVAHDADEDLTLLG